MRLLLIVLALPLLALQAQAQTAMPQPAAPPPATAAAGTLAQDATAAPEHHRMTWQQRFAKANIAHDGHLTAQEASGGYPSVAHHFQEIDADKKGFVTEEDISNWHKLQRATHHHARTDEGLRPQHAMQQGLTEPSQIRRTSTDRTVLPMAQPDAQPTGQQAIAK